MSNDSFATAANRIVLQAQRWVHECRAQLAHLLAESRNEYQGAISELDRLGVMNPEENATGTLNRSLLANQSAKEFDIAVSRLNDAIVELDGAADALDGRPVRLSASREHLEITMEAVAIQAQEEERYRLAREVHDGPAQILSNIALQLEYISKLAERDPGRARDELAIIQKDLRLALGEVRRFMYDLRPPALSQGVEAALESHCQRLSERFGLQINVQWQNPSLLQPSHDTAIFRIVQEALQNVVKHSRATRVEVQAKEEDGYLEVAISDNGQGFEPKQIQQLGPDHFGLTGMRARAQQIGASIEVSSIPGRGTDVVLRVPLGQQ